MHFRSVAPLLQGLFLGLLALGFAKNSLAQDEPPAPEPKRQEIEAVIQTLESPEAREKLVAQLRIMAQASEEMSAPESEVATATAEILRSISERMNELGKRASQVGRAVKELPQAASSVERTLKDPEERARWAMVILRLAVTLGVGYLAAWLVTRLLVRPWRSAGAAVPAGAPDRLITLIGLLVLDLVPVATFAGAAYLTLTIIDPMEETRLVALAWINASVIVRVVKAVGRFLLSPDAPNMRLTPADDETAHYLQIWLHRITGTAVYGYFGLQAAALLGLGPPAYNALLDLLGLVILVLLLILIMQNRVAVARFIRGDAADETQGRTGIRVLRHRIAQSWHLLAAVYLILLYGVWALEVHQGFAYVLKATLLSAAVVVAARIILKLLETLFQRGMRVGDDVGQRFPGLEARVNRYFPYLRKAINAVVYAVAALALMEAWGLDAFTWLASEPGRVLGSAAARIAGIVVVSLLIWEVTSSFIERYLAAAEVRGETPAHAARTKTLLNVARNALLVVVGVVSTLMVLSELGVNIGPLLAGAGVLGLAVGFGAQRLVQDVITGVFILFQDLMAVGDVVKLGDRAGLVEALSIRTVRLRDLSGTVHTIPFSAISTVSNLTKEFSFYVFDMGVAYREDVDQVMELLVRIGEELQADAEIGPLMLDPIEVFGVDAFGDSAVVIKGRIKTLPIKQWAVGRAFNRLVKKRFDEAGIEIPFPHRTIYFGQGKDGAATPARVQVSPGIAVEGAPYELLDDEAARARPKEQNK